MSVNKHADFDFVYVCVRNAQTRENKFSQMEACARARSPTVRGTRANTKRVQKSPASVILSDTF